MKKGFNAFTLAEILIVLGVIGIIAVVVIPSVVNNINESSWTKAKKNFEAKITEAAKQMNVAGELSGYLNNAAFADAFQKYIKVVQRCAPPNLSDCFVSVFRHSNAAGGKEINTNDDLQIGTDIGNESSSNLVGLNIIDGTNVILAFNPDCQQLEWVNNQPSDLTSCLSILYDINGKKGPNQMGKDIDGINVTLGSCIKIGPYCISETNVAYTSENTAADQTWDTYQLAANYWAGARKACAAQGMHLMTEAEARMLAENPSLCNALRATGISGYYWVYRNSDYGYVAASCYLKVDTFDTPGCVLEEGSIQGKNSGFFSTRCVK